MRIGIKKFPNWFQISKIILKLLKQVNLKFVL